ncbi:MAG: hypothetical protein JW798_02095 [Prolixibacteraceae bacterium]|nr:hypothetical protein [Prolixibacteraceae bacterium]
MKVILILSFLIVVIFGFSCEKDDSFQRQDNDTIFYAAFDSHVMVLNDQPFEFDIDQDNDTDLWFKVKQEDTKVNGVQYSWLYCEVTSLQDYIKLAWGAQGSSFKYYVENGSKVSSNRFFFEDRVTIAGSIFVKNDGVWVLEKKPERYIGIQSEDDEGFCYGWIHLSFTDSTLSIKEIALSKIHDQAIIAGAKPE